jgi:hypothetical protein
MCSAPQPIPDNFGSVCDPSKERRPVGSNVRRGARRTHSPDGSEGECVGADRCGNPKRVAGCSLSGTTVGQDSAKQEPIDTLGRRWIGGVIVRSAKRVRGGRAKSRPRHLRRTLEGRSPWELPAAGVLNPCRSVGTLGRVKAQEPRPAGPATRYGAGYIGRRNGMWAFLVRKRAGYLSREWTVSSVDLTAIISCQATTDQ